MNKNYHEDSQPSFPYIPPWKRSSYETRIESPVSACAKKPTDHAKTELSVFQYFPASMEYWNILTDDVYRGTSTCTEYSQMHAIAIYWWLVARGGQLKSHIIMKVKLCLVCCLVCCLGCLPVQVQVGTGTAPLCWCSRDSTHSLMMLRRKKWSPSHQRFWRGAYKNWRRAKLPPVLYKTNSPLLFQIQWPKSVPVISAGPTPRPPPAFPKRNYE